MRTTALLGLAFQAIFRNRALLWCNACLSVHLADADRAHTSNLGELPVFSWRDEPLLYSRRASTAQVSIGQEFRLARLRKGSEGTLRYLGLLTASISLVLAAIALGQEPLRLKLPFPLAYRLALTGWLRFPHAAQRKPCSPRHCGSLSHLTHELPKLFADSGVR